VIIKILEISGSPGIFGSFAKVSVRKRPKRVASSVEGKFLALS
jgi:hypothetical protein